MSFKHKMELRPRKKMKETKDSGIGKYARLIDFDSEIQNPWGIQYWSRAKAQFCVITCSAYLSKTASLSRKCPWVQCPGNVHLLVAKQHDNIAWDDILNTSQREMLERDGEIALGYVVAEKQFGQLRIHWIQSFVKRQGVMRKIIQELEETFKTLEIIPYDMGNTPPYAIKAWKQLGFNVDT